MKARPYDKYEFQDAPALLEVVSTRVGLGFLLSNDDPAIALMLSVLADPDDPASLSEIKFQLTMTQAASLSAALDGAVLAAIDVLAIQEGAAVVATEQTKRDMERKHRIHASATRRDMAKVAGDRQSRCGWEGCTRVAVITEGDRHYCKRHAEQAGIRPKGKI